MNNMRQASSSPLLRAARSRRHRSLLTAFLPLATVASLATGCGDDADATTPKDEPSSTTWTIFVYGHGDHNLSASLLKDIQEMTKAELTEDVHVVVAADWDASRNIDAKGTKFPEGTHWLLIRGGGEQAQDLGVDPEQNLDDPAVLADAVQRAFERFPATRRGLILWDHGGSWMGGFGHDTQNGTAVGAAMSAPSVAKAVRDGLDAAGIKAERPLDFLSFDTCLMGSTEVAFELRDLAQTYIANAEIDYGDGWDYEETLSYIARHPDASASDIAVSEVAIWDRHHEDSGNDMDALMRSHVAVDLTRYDAYAAALKQLAVLLRDNPSLASAAARASYFSLPNYGFTSPISGGETGTFNRDAGQFLRALEASTDEALANAAKAARVALEDAILDKSQGSLRDIGNEAGWQLTLPQISAFFAPPPGMQTDALLSDVYKERTKAFQQVVPWGATLDAVARANDGQAPSFSISTSDAPDPQGPPAMTLKVTDPDAASARLSVSQRDPQTGALIRFGVMAGGKVENNGSYTLAWDETLVAMGEGADAQPVFIERGPDLGLDPRTGDDLPVILTVPGVLSVPGQSGATFCRLLVERGTSYASKLVLYSAGNQAVTDIDKLRESYPGLQFAPGFLLVDPETGKESQVVGRPVTLDGAYIVLGSMPAPAGTYEFSLDVFDVFDNVGSGKLDVTVAAR